MKRTLTILFFIIETVWCFAQSDTTILRQVEVHSAVLKDGFTAGTSIISWDSTVLSNYQGGDLGTLLAGESGTFIKTYGLGNLATSSVRGAAAHHTKVLWNGFDVTNPMLGQADLAYFSVDVFDEVSFQAGGGAGLYGGGTQGGVIRLRTMNVKDDQISLGLGFGSFGDFSRQAVLNTSNKSVATKISVSSRNAENNFEYEENGIAVNRENADVTTFSGMVHNTIKLNAYHHLEVSHWYQQNDRGIPTVMGVPRRGERLQNEFLRHTLNYRFFGKAVEWRIGGAHFNEKLIYSDPLSGWYSPSRFQKTIAEAEAKWSIQQNTTVLFGMHHTLDRVFSESFVDRLNRNTSAILGSVNHDLWKNRVALNVSVRQEIVTGFNIPFTGSFGYDAEVVKNMRLFGNVSKNYRIPTFNDLYYAGLGNPELRPESGWGGEQSVSWESNDVKITSTTFYNEYTDWIIWQPQQGGLWRPTNIDVTTQGIEARIEGNQRIAKKSTLHFRSNATYVKSTDRRTGWQLIYVPKIKSGGLVGVSIRNTSVNYSHNWNGERFISSDNVYELPFFQLGKLQVSQLFPVQQHGIISADFTIHNIWNAQYQAILNFPMPGRYYAFNLNINFKQYNNDQTTI